MKKKLIEISKMRPNGDGAVWSVAVMLAIYSLLVVYSATISLSFNKHGGNTEYYLLRHGFMLMLGFGVMYLTAKIPYHYFSRFSQVGLWISIPLLLFTLIGGTNLNNANRWLPIPGTGITFQPSDLAKLVIILYTARMIGKLQSLNEMDDFKMVFQKIMLPVLVICMLILPANFSTALLVGLACYVLMFVGGVKIKHLGYLAGICIVGAMLALAVATVAPNILPRAKTWVARIENFGNEDAEGNFQSEHSKIAIASGGITGVGPGHSSQRNILPHSSSDFIFAITIEEYGLFVGAIFVIALYMILMYRGVRICGQCNKTFGSLSAFGIVFLIVAQALVNMSVATGIIPVTGQTLPFVSMGGTSILLTGASLGVVISISTSIGGKSGSEKSKTEKIED